MNNWIKRTLVGTATLTVLLGGLSACGSYSHRHGWSEERVGEMRGKAVDRIASKLALDAGQKSKLDALADAMMAQRQALRGAAPGSEPRAQLKALVAGEKFDRTGARRLLDEKMGAVQAQGPKVLDAMADFYDSLNPTQQAQVREKMDRRGRGRW